MNAWRLVAAIAAGAALGFLGAYADFTLAAGWFGRLANALGNTAPGWLFVAAVVAWRAETPRRGALYGFSALVAAVLVYYLMTHAYGQRGVGAGALLEAAILWSFAATVCGALVGATIPVASDRSRWRVAIVCGVTGGALLIWPIYEGLLSLAAGPPWGFYGLSAREAALRLLAAVCGVAIPAVWPRGPRRALVACAIAAAIGLAVATQGFVSWSHQRAAIDATTGIEGTLHDLR